VGTESQGWQPSVEHLRSVLGMTAAIGRGDGGAIRALTRDMTLQQGAMSCFALAQLLLARLADLMGKSVQDVVAQLSLELGTDRS
jgi:hypothetical protein